MTAGRRGSPPRRLCTGVASAPELVPAPPPQTQADPRRRNKSIPGRQTARILRPIFARTKGRHRWRPTGGARCGAGGRARPSQERNPPAGEVAGRRRFKARFKGAWSGARLSGLPGSPGQRRYPTPWGSRGMAPGRPPWGSGAGKAIAAIAAEARTGEATSPPA